MSLARYLEHLIITFFNCHSPYGPIYHLARFEGPVVNIQLVEGKSVGARENGFLHVQTLKLSSILPIRTTLRRAHAFLATVY